MEGVGLKKKQNDTYCIQKIFCVKETDKVVHLENHKLQQT